jgi:hypothetical protein
MNSENEVSVSCGSAVGNGGVEVNLGSVAWIW